jgi:hypothetical protein
MPFFYNCTTTLTGRGEERKIFFSCNPAGSEEEKTLTKIANP